MGTLEAGGSWVAGFFVAGRPDRLDVAARTNQEIGKEAVRHRRDRIYRYVLKRFGLDFLRHCYANQKTSALRGDG